MKPFGLVLAGGGGKGAYQIGVWKCLREYGMEEYITAVSGTSVGALNGALVTQGDYDRAEALWLGIRPELILTPKMVNRQMRRGLHSLEQAEEDEATSAGLPPSPAAEAAGAALNAAALAVVGQLSAPAPLSSSAAVSALTTAVQGMVSGKSGIFSRSGLLSLMDRGVDFSRIAAASIPCFATCLSFPALKVERFDLRGCPEEESRALLLASSAIPLIFDAERFRDKYYYDGGFPVLGDNVPVSPLYDMGIKNILVIHLDQSQRVNREDFPNAHIFEVTPSVDLGNFFTGSLNFSAETVRQHIQQGYLDMRQVLDPFADWE